MVTSFTISLAASSASSQTRVIARAVSLILMTTPPFRPPRQAGRAPLTISRLAFHRDPQGVKRVATNAGKLVKDDTPGFLNGVLKHWKETWLVANPAKPRGWWQDARRIGKSLRRSK